MRSNFLTKKKKIDDKQALSGLRGMNRHGTIDERCRRGPNKQPNLLNVEQCDNRNFVGRMKLSEEQCVTRR